MSIVEFLSQPLWQRLGLTLVHFLWQGLAVVALVGVLVRVFRLNHGNARYAAYLLAFIAMIVSPVVTFIAIDIPISPDTELVTGARSAEVVETSSYAALPTGDMLAEAETSSPAMPTLADSIPLGQRISDLLNVSMPWALVIWMVGVVVLSMRLLMGFVGVYRWRHHLEPLPERLVQRIVSLSEGLGMRGFSGVFISPTVLQAMAVGYIRPMVLLPAAMVTQMQPEMLEAVIAHELAHIRRLDLWVNLAQRVTETLLFYHPAVWWLSKCLRSERELCCDELAVKATGQRLAYATTLENVGRARFVAKQPILATGLGQDNKPTLSRVRHILGLTPTRRNCPFWLAGVITVLFLVTLTISTALALTSRPGAKIDVKHEQKINFSVKVLGADNKPIEHARVFSHRVDSKLNNKFVYNRISYDGGIAEFNDTNTTPGLHTIYALTEYTDEPYVGVTQVEINEPNTVVELKLKRAAYLTGTITDKKGLPVPLAYVTPNPILKDFHGSFNHAKFNGHTDEAGQFKILAVSGLKYKLQINARKGSFTIEPPDPRCIPVISGKSAVQAEIQEKEDPKEFSKFARTLPNGVTVELVGVCEYPSAGKQWWRPDGTPFTLPAGIKVEDRISKARVGDNAYQFLFRHNLQEDPMWNSSDAGYLHFSIEEDSGPDLINYLRLPKGGQDGLVAKVAIFKEPLDSTTVQANLATGSWQTQAVRDISKIDQLNEDLYWITSKSANYTWVEILHRIEGQQIKTIAIDREGNEYDSSYSLGSFNGWMTLSQLDGRRYVARLRKDDRLVKFKLQSRPFWSSVIGNVSLKPNLKTDVQIEVEENAGQLVVEGIRANRDKFECGYLAWSSKQITARFADSNRPATDLEGQYELWWDGNKKIATKYVRDQVYKDPEGNFRVEKQQGGTSYDGGVLSWKPDFHSDNWLGPEITRWRGLGSHDWLIQYDSKLKNISKDWSVIEINGVKLIRTVTKNTNETDVDYRAYSIRDYDPSKGYGLVNQEWYNPNGSPRLKHTVKLLEVLPGGWFPVEVDSKSFTITDGRVYTHNHYALDIERCSFNDKSALPKGIFKLGMEKQLKYQEKLQKYLAMELKGLSVVKEIEKADKVKLGAREAIEKFVAAAMAGDFEEARQFADPNGAVAKQVEDMPEVLKGQNLWIMAVVADDFSAIAVSSVILGGDPDRTGPLVFLLDRAPQDGRDNWWVHDIDIETPDGAEVELKQFLEKHPKAQKVP